MKFEIGLKTILLVLLLVPSQTTWAADKCPEDVQVIDKGQVANCSGVLLSPDASKKADESIEDAKYYKGLSDKLQLRISYSIKETDILETRLKLYMDQSQTLAEALVKEEHQSDWQKFGYILLGVIVTGVAVNVASDFTR